ncbi:HlyD family efflux transporter periplasmic adaptor subunit [Rhodovarius crocodyli]|uniref:HlyD family efflux transporter periplasmic adaptor subunit n=1 Tax=Rhodovarius crocodyli TaxID=1979269 RepID=A0A437M2B7_9PROT|nr:efflux RND transporter periplasmic adaptor subunit [Rhodovarius crocodyli]RVT91762.1 HlyD family efflux transporter periplasmic adaptor subunit [Rhodovarius crocodyli]
MRQTARRLLRGVLLLGMLGALGVLLYAATLPPPLTVQGEVSADRVDISPRVAGRIARLAAGVGEEIEQGALLAELESPQLGAALLAARAALGVAIAEDARIRSTRPETIAMRRAELASAQSDVVLNQEAYSRQAQLLRTGNTPQARVDEAIRNLETAQRRRDAADAALRLASTGASEEERALASAQVEQARAALHQREVDVAELAVRSPIQGLVTTRVAELGENFSAGAPLFSLIDMRRLWLTFNLREDLLAGLAIGDRFEVTVPALSAVRIAVRVTMINVQGQYATWRATRATGDFDLRTFEVRAVPVEAATGLRPGMSVIAAWNR